MSRADHLQARGIHVQHGAVAGDELYAFGIGFDDGAKTLFAFPQRFFCADPVGDVAGHFRSADDLAGGVSNGRYRERDIDGGSVLTATNGVEMLDAFAATEPREDFDFFVTPLRGYDHGDVLSDGL